jgi:L-fucose isomerase-like protein
MRNEYVDMSELVRRFEEKIYSDASTNGPSRG